MRTGLHIPVAKIRENLLLAMNMGLPEEESQRPTFVFLPTTQTSAAADDKGLPFDPEAEVDHGEPIKVQVPCAYEVRYREGVDVDFGVLIPTKIRITLLDEEYLQVKGFDYALIGGEKFNYERTDVPYALGQMGVMTVWCVAEDDGENES